MPNTEMFAANHGHTRSRGRAVRSDSAMISMPVVSMRPGPPAADGAPLDGAPLDGAGEAEGGVEEGDMLGSGGGRGGRPRGALA